jgi:uncharacterized protein (TIGR03663 family)
MMTVPPDVQESTLDRWLSRTLALDWEKVAWLSIVVLTLVTRLWHLGDRAMSHDESLHTYYSWKLFDGQGYQHDPMMHGPLLYHATALFYWLFGASDFTARLLGVVTGLLLVLSPLLLRKWLGRGGAVAAGLMLLVSPTVMYYSRYIRHDIPVELFTVLMVVAFIRFLDSRQGRWVILAFAAGAGAVTSAEMAYINGFVLLGFVAIALLAERLSPRASYWTEFALLVLGLGFLLFASAASMGRLGNIAAEGSSQRIAMQLGLLFGGILMIYGLVSPLLSRVRSVPSGGGEGGDWRLLDLLPQELAATKGDVGAPEARARMLRVLIAGAVALVAGIVMWRAPELAPEAAKTAPWSTLLAALSSVGLLATLVGCVLALYGVVAQVAGRGAAWANRIAVGLGLVAAAACGAAWVYLAPEKAMDSKFAALTVGLRAPVVALLGGAVVVVVLGLIGWALEARERRGLAAALADAPVEAIIAGAVVFGVIYTLLFTTFFTNPQGINGFSKSIQYWLEQHDVVRGGQPWYYYGLFTPMYEFLPFILSIVGLVWYALRRASRVGRGNDTGDPDAPSAAAWAFVPMLLVWGMGVFWIYSWAGEKMPWLIVHLVVPMTFLGGRVIGDALSALDWDEVRARGWIVMGLTTVLVAGLVSWLLIGPFQGQTQDALSRTSGWIVGLPVLAVVAWALWRVCSRMPRRQWQVAVALTFAALLFTANIHYSLQANFVNDQLATEYIVYAHGTPDDKEVVNMFLDMQARLGENRPLSVGYDNEVSWPFTWYFRADQFPAARYLDQKPTATVTEDVVLVGSPNYGNFEPYLRDRYVSMEFRRMWWPNEGYKDLTWERIRDTLVNPKLRRNLLNIVLFRKYTVDPLADDPQPKPLNDWYHHANMRLYVRKDLIEKIWPLVQARPDWLKDVSTQAEPSKSLTLKVQQVYDTGADGQPMVTPKDIALGPDGRVYAVDLGQARVVVFGDDGKAQADIASGDLKEVSTEAHAPSAWGVGVGATGAVYIADTWNHRVLKYVDGKKTAEFGKYGNPGSADAQLDLLFGPRDIAIASDGSLYVTDTGNDRIVVLDADLKPLRAFGGAGVDPGKFDEPTSVAFDPATGDLFVADLWNLRVQRFDKDLKPVTSWTVDGWTSQEAAHKAYIAVGPGSTVVASDPSGQRVWVWDNQGKLLGTLDLPDDNRGLDEPIGVAVDAIGRVFVASSVSGIVTRYEPIEAIVKQAGLAPAEGVPPVKVQEEGASPSPTAPTQAEGAAGESSPAVAVSPTATGQVEGAAGGAGAAGAAASPTAPVGGPTGRSGAPSATP